MNPNNEGAPTGGGGKKNSKKNRNQGDQQNAASSEQKKSINKGAQNPLQQQMKQDHSNQPQGQPIEVSKQQNPPKGKKDRNQGNPQIATSSQLKKSDNGSKENPPRQQKINQPQGEFEGQKGQNLPKSKKGKKDPSQNKPIQDQPKQTKPANVPESSQKQGGNIQSAKPPVQIQGGNQQIEQKIEILKNNLHIPKRRNTKVGGTLGRPTEIDVNYLPLNLDKLFSKTVYHIDVQFEPDLPKRLLRSALEEFNRKHYPNLQFAFDGRRNMYTTKNLKGRSDTISITNEENNRTIDFNIVTSVVNEISMKKIQEYLKNGSSNTPPGEAFQALDIVLKNRPFSLRYTNIGRSFFPVPRVLPVDLGEGMELWKGFFQSPVMGWKPYLNIDVAHKGFPKYQLLTQYISNEMNCPLDREMDLRNINTLSNYVKGLKIDFMIPNQPNTKRSYKAVGLLESAEKFHFEMEDPNTRRSRNLNVVQYFRLVRNYDIKYPKLPCLHVGNINKKTAIPIELCTVQKGQLRMKKLTESQTANMVRNAARPPSERRQTIESCIRDIKYNQDSVLREFGIDIEERFASVPARVLDQPSLAYFQNKELKPRAGVWKPDKFSKSVQLKRWIVLNLDQRTNIANIKNFERSLIASGKDLNVNISPMDPVINHVIQRNVRLNDIQKEVTLIFNRLKNVVELIVVIIPDYPPGIYAAVKQSSELTVGVLTQCIKSKTIFKMNMSTASNILLKINSKLNGVNHTLSAKSRPASMDGSIIFGADVTHPSPDQTNIPSVAAVAASHDISGSQYNMEWRLQSPKVEIIQDLEGIVHKQLLKFKENTKSVPRKIFYFRDGVSEGQFLQLLEYELIAIRRACLRLNMNYNPSVTFLVVQKRHHTRMFPKFSQDFDGKFGNVPSGTIIDTQITHPTELDFYLCSHASIQGTSRPTKYHLIWDDNSFTEDQLEQITFYLCFMFARCTRSVSYPAPTYYAHLAAFRARAYIENKQINLNRLDEEQSNNELNSSFTVNTPMFFV